MNQKIIIVLLGILLIGGIIFYFNSQKTQQVDGIRPTIVSENGAEDISKSDSEMVIAKINEVRGTSGLLEIKFDEKLCSYAKRVALIEIENDAKPGDPPVKNDVESKEVQKTYFAPYSSSMLELNFYKGQDLDINVVADNFASNKSSSALAVNTAGGCVGGVYSSKIGGWVINFVGGGVK